MRPRHPAAAHRAAVLLLATMGLAGCVAPTPTPSPAATATPAVTAAPQQTDAPSASPAASPSPTPEPPLSLDLPDETDERQVAVTVTPQVGADGGELIVTVVNRSDTRIGEIVLRFSTALKETLVLAPFAPTADRIREGGSPLIQAWSKWVAGPGEMGEPAGTTSIGWGPMDPGMGLEIALQVTRVAAGPVAFDLQLLDGEALLTLESGGPAELRVEVP